ncbi:MAG TPA: NAD-dependent dehydratase [Candidatus Omnitrophica bacterium]|nr:NAD-dependent dehydratase [Candidatus Omnitrophota bacterium]
MRDFESSLNSEIHRFVILGDSGFIGTHLKRRFQYLFPEMECMGLSYPAIDLTKEGEAGRLAEIFDGHTAVVLLAAIKRQFGDTLDTFLQNMLMTVNIARVLEKHPVRRFIFFSSTAVYGEDIHNTRITEGTPIQPTSYYGLAKYAAERLLTKVMSARDGGFLTILRPPLIYGPGDLGATYGPVGFLKAALHKEPITLWGDGTELREFLYVEDISEIVCRLALRAHAGVLNVASGQSYTFRDVLGILSGLLFSELNITSRQRTKDKVDNAFDNARFVQLFRDFSFTGLEDGMKLTCAFENKRQADKAETETVGNP